MSALQPPKPFKTLPELVELLRERGMTISDVDRQKSQRNAWREWLARHQKQINQSKEDSVVWHRAQNKSMPIWVVCEAWDFGTVSKYFEILKQTHQNRIAKRLGVDNPKVLVAWLHEISTLRNRCAHHCRVWNQKTSNALPDATSVDFARFVMAGEASSRLYGLIAVIAFLLRNIGPNSGWLDQVADALATKPDLPGVTYSAMGMYESIGVSTRLFIE